jgi:hypothetical protein
MANSISGDSRLPHLNPTSEVAPRARTREVAAPTFSEPDPAAPAYLNQVMEDLQSIRQLGRGRAG